MVWCAASASSAPASTRFTRKASTCRPLFALDINGSTVESTGLGLDIGDADRICYPIPDTLCNEPWQKRPTAQLLMTMHELEGEPFFADPREVLRQVVSKFDDMGLTICAAFELEFYLIDQENVNGRPQPPRSPISGKRPQSTQVYLIDDLDEYADCLQDILEGAKEQGIPADAIVKESAPAQFEVNLHHVADPIKACDYAVLLKRLIKNIAYDHEMDTTFMAKPIRARQATVCMSTSRAGQRWQQHLHQRGSRAERRAASRVGGVLETLPARWRSSARTSTRTAASAHSSTCRTRRAGAWTTAPWPCAYRPVRRRGAHRTPRGRCRCQPVPDDGCGPGRRAPRPDQQDRTGRPIEGNSYEQLEQSLPNNLRDALRELDDSEVLNKYIDPKYIDIFVACKESELESSSTRSPTSSTTGTCIPCKRKRRPQGRRFVSASPGRCATLFAVGRACAMSYRAASRKSSNYAGSCTATPAPPAAAPRH
jgi:glutamine synthetase